MGIEKRVLEDIESAPLPHGWEKMTGGEIWRRAAAVGHPKLDPVPMKVVLEGDTAKPLMRYTVELRIDKWIAAHEIRRVKGAWTAVSVEYRPRFTGVVGAPSAREKRRASLERHRSRIDALLKDAEDDLAAVFPEKPNHWRHARFQWSITAPRSRRGRARVIDVDEILRLRGEGLPDREIADRFGVHRKAVGNALARAKGRLRWGE